MKPEELLVSLGLAKDERSARGAVSDAYLAGVFRCEQKGCGHYMVLPNNLCSVRYPLKGVKEIDEELLAAFAAVYVGKRHKMLR